MMPSHKNAQGASTARSPGPPPAPAARAPASGAAAMTHATTQFLTSVYGLGAGVRGMTRRQVLSSSMHALVGGWLWGKVQ